MSEDNKSELPVKKEIISEGNIVPDRETQQGTKNTADDLLKEYLNGTHGRRPPRKNEPAILVDKGTGPGNKPGTS